VSKQGEVAEMAENESQTAELTAKQRMFIDALLSGMAIIDAVKVVGIGESTAYRWLKEPTFAQAYAEARRAIFDESLSHLMTDIRIARATLVEVMQDREASASARVAASKIVLESAIELYKATELEQRIAELERGGRR